MRGRPFWDAFCGGLSMSLALSERGVGCATDGNPALISLYQAVADGWDPPSTVTEDEYRAARGLPDSDPRKAFYGFGCSFGGKWFAGFARDPKRAPDDRRNFADTARRALLRDVGLLRERGVTFAHLDFLAVEPGPINAVLYLDPPYAGTTVYGATGAFDYPRFYGRVREWSRHTDVFISEYRMPGEPLMEFAHDMSVAGGVQKDARRERLYHYAPDRPGPLLWA
jgi:DNA adenine methylase